MYSSGFDIQTIPVLLLFILAVKSSNIHLFEDKQSWLDALKSCETKGGRMLLQSEYSSSGISDVISSSFEFWIGDYVYSNWMSIEGCYHMDTLQVQLKMPMPIKIKSPCWNECHQNGYKYFALRRGQCLCLQTLPRRPQHDVIGCLYVCSGGIGLCGSDDGHYVSVYTNSNIEGNMESNLPPKGQYTTQSDYSECASRNCITDKYYAQSCGNSLRYICETSDTPTTAANWTMAFLNCIRSGHGYIPNTCMRYKNGETVWINAFREILPPETIGTWTDVATAMKCKIGNASGELSCNSETTQPFTKLPYMCQFSTDTPFVVGLTTRIYSTISEDFNVTYFPSKEDKKYGMVISLTTAAMILCILFASIAAYILCCRKSCKFNSEIKRDENRNIRLCVIGTNNSPSQSFSVSVGTNDDRCFNERDYIEENPETIYQHYAEINEDNLEPTKESSGYEEPWGCKNTERPLPEIPKSSIPSIYV